MIFILLHSVSSSFYRQQFLQKLDHYDTHTDDYFNQTFLTDLDPNISTNSVLIILGEFSPVYEDMANSKALLDLKEQTNARIIILEHRYFGSSLPLGGLTLRNRNFLMIHQALADIDYFLQYVHNHLCSESCNIGLIGSGYAGSLAAWSRVRYPHLTIGAWSSSAPLNMMPEFSYYDEFYAQKLEETKNGCLDSTKTVFDLIEQIIDNEDIKSINQLKKMFDFELNQDNVSLLYAIAEVLSLPLRKPNPSNMLNHYCNEITANATIDTLSDLYNSFLSEFNRTSDYFDPFLSINYPDLYSYLWLQCNQIGWFHTSSGRLRSDKINLTYFNTVCEKTFGINVTDSTISNTVFGGIDPYLSNAIFTNGENDPYKVLSVQDEVESMGRLSINIKEAGPSADLYTNDKSDQEYAQNDIHKKSSLKAANIDEVQERCIRKMSEWINHECEKKCVQGTCILSKCVCNSMWDGEFCTRRSHTLVAYSIITAICILAPTLILLFFGMFVLFFGTKGDAEIDNSRKSYFT